MKPGETAEGRRLRFQGVAFVLFAIGIGLVLWGPDQRVWTWVAWAFGSAGLSGVIWGWGRYLAEERDEYVRMLHVRALLWASGFALTAACVWGFAETLGLVRPINPIFVVWAWLIGFWASRIGRGLRDGRER